MSICLKWRSGRNDRLYIREWKRMGKIAVLNLQSRHHIWFRSCERDEGMFGKAFQWWRLAGDRSHSTLANLNQLHSNEWAELIFDSVFDSFFLFIFYFFLRLIKDFVANLKLKPTLYCKNNWFSSSTYCIYSFLERQSLLHRL